jgi:glycosyltransferase involved in cell wall biosynthesis
VEDGTPLGMVQAILDLLEDPLRRHDLGASARASAERFRWSRVAALHLRFLEQVAGS